MNKRQQKKRDQLLRVAIRELNDDIATSEGFAPTTEEEINQTLKHVKKTNGAVRRTLNDYKRYILDAQTIQLKTKPMEATWK